ncbi:MAG: hypothetical protein U0166_12595 [Acidobacteriota bacterium]
MALIPSIATFSSARKWAPTASVIALSEIVRASKTSSEQVITVRMPSRSSHVTPVSRTISSTQSNAISWNRFHQRLSKNPVCDTAQIATRLPCIIRGFPAPSSSRSHRS